MAKLSAREVANDIRSGMDDTGLMAKYQLSAQGLRVLFRKLLDMKALTQADLANRTPASDQTMALSWRCPSCQKPQPAKVEECPDCGIIVEKFLERQERTQKQEPESSKTVEDTPGFFRRFELLYGSKVYIATLVAGLLLISALVWLVPVKSPKTNDDGQTPLISASFKGDALAVRALLDQGADVNAKKNDGDTALITASFFDEVEIAKLLIDRGADVNAKDNHGYTALMSASIGGSVEVAKVLLAKGADVNARNNENRTALDFAATKGHSEVVEVLKAHGAKK